LNTIISYDFDLAGHSEIVDYFISFLKMLALKINKNSIQFFYNKRFKDFPLYGTAVKLYNHQEPMVRTAARTITLTVYSIRNQEITNAVLSLPHASYFPHMACELRDRWMKIDQNIITDLDVEDLKDDLEDVSDMLMYIQDIFNLNISDLTIALSNSLLYYAYLPSIIGSLGCMSKNPDINSYSASIFFLNQTYDHLKEPLFINALSCGLFLSQIPSQYAKWVENVVRPPSTYRRKYSNKSKEYNFIRYVEENLSKINIEGFVMGEYGFLNDLQDDYQKLKETKEEEEIDDTYDRSDEYQREALELVISRIKSNELARIKDLHLSLSIALGRPVGVWERTKGYAYLSPTDYSEAILDSMYNDNFLMYAKQEEFTTNKYSKTLINFLRSKDDSLLLLIGSLFYCYTLSDTVDPALLYETKMYPIGNRKKNQLLHSLINSEEVKVTTPSKKSKLNFEEDKSLISGSRRDRVEYERRMLENATGCFYDDKIMDMLLDLLRVDPNFRPITFKFLSVIACNLCHNKNSNE
jgi:hypothetical protein